jgi:hypothetical protein
VPSADSRARTGSDFSGPSCASGELKGAENFDWAYKKMTRMKPFDLLKLIRGTGGHLSPENEEAVKQALKIRNFLAHGFFHKYSPVLGAKECDRVASRLRKIDSDLKAAFQLLQSLKRNLEQRLGITPHCPTDTESFLKKAVDAIASFDDEPQEPL